MIYDDHDDYGLNEELGRHRGREGRSQLQCMTLLRDDDCECCSCVVGLSSIIILEFYGRTFAFTRICFHNYFYL